jgi:tRNA modification GTPase
MADADIVIVMIDASDRVTDEDIEILRSVSELQHIVAFNKADKVSDERLDATIGEFRCERPVETDLVTISAKTGQGLADLKTAIIHPFEAAEETSTGFLVSDARHFDLLQRGADEVEQSIDSLKHNASEEIVLIGLHNALGFLGQITGETTTEDMLTRIFATFCIGK